MSLSWSNFDDLQRVFVQLVVRSALLKVVLERHNLWLPKLLAIKNMVQKLICGVPVFCSTSYYVGDYRSLVHDVKSTRVSPRAGIR